LFEESEGRRDRKKDSEKYGRKKAQETQNPEQN
jgi:hypothetical protein